MQCCQDVRCHYVLLVTHRCVWKQVLFPQWNLIHQLTNHMPTVMTTTTTCSSSTTTTTTTTTTMTTAGNKNCNSKQWCLQGCHHGIAIARVHSIAVAVTSKWCTGKPDPSNLYQDEGWWLALAEVETCQWSTTHHLDPPDLSWHGCYSDWGPAASGGQTVLANNRNGGRLRLIASRHYYYYYYSGSAMITAESRCIRRVAARPNRLTWAPDPPKLAATVLHSPLPFGKTQPES